jgi:hypothetical protein
MYTIIVPARDFKCIEQYLKRGRITPETIELLGRKYEVGDDRYVITAEILERQQAVRYTISDGEHTASVEIRSPVCVFGGWGVTCAFDADKGYD